MKLRSSKKNISLILPKIDENKCELPNDQNYMLKINKNDGDFQLTFEIRDTKCRKCNVLFKRSNLNKSLECRAKCVNISFGEIPMCIKRLTSSEKESLRLIKIYAKQQYSNNYMYARFQGTSHLSLNWNVWQLCSGLISYNNSYNKRTLRFNNKIKTALKWLIENNKLYEDFVFPKETIEYFMEFDDTDAKIFAKSSGEVFSVPKHIDQSQFGKDDSSYNLLPVGELVKNGAKEVFSVAFKNKEAYLFPYLFPTGNSFLHNSNTARAMIVRNNLMNIDNRFRSSNDYIFYQFDLMEKFRIANSNFRALTNSAKNNCSVSQVLSNSKYDNRAIFDDEYSTSMPNTIRGSDTYFKQARINLIAMTAKFGKPHLFVTFNCSESTWPELHDYLKKFGKEPQDKENLYTANPFLCNHYCYNRLQSMFNFIIKDGYMDQKVLHFFKRFEFQKRGTVHMHLLLWLETSDMNTLLSGVSAQIPAFKEDPLLHHIVKYYQIHSHGPYCQANNKKCRFDFPKKYQEKSYYDPVLDRYFIKRNDSECMVNEYHPKWARYWKGNMDLKPDCNEYVCNYIVKYSTKPEPFSVTEIKVNLTKKYIESRDYSVHEICHYLMGNHITEFSTKVAKVGLCLSLVDKRYLRKLSDLKLLKQHDPESRNIEYANDMDRYQNRPIDLEDLTIIQFFENYEKCSSDHSKHFKDKKNVSWKKRLKPIIIRVYPYYSAYMGDFYYNQIVLKSVPFRCANTLLDSIPCTRDYVNCNFIGDLEQNLLIDQEIDLLEQELIEKQDILNIRNMYSLKINDFYATPNDLNSDQYEIYKSILFNNDRFHIVSGEPGTGKSFLIKILNQGLLSLNKTISLTASTGVASFLIGGVTVHSTLKLRYFEHEKSWKTLLFDNKADIPYFDVLVIDEFSMIGKELFEKIVEILNSETFAHAKLVLFGDQFQLPPVGDDCFYQSEYFKMFIKKTLSLNMRSKDPVLTNMINSFYNINISIENRKIEILKFINSRLTLMTFEEDSPYVYATNRACRRHNESMLSILNTPIYNITFENNSSKNNYFNDNIDQSIKSKFRYLHTLRVAVGAKIILLKNIDIRQGLVNGSIGIVREIQYSMSGSFMIVEFIVKEGTKLVKLQPDLECHDNVILYQFPVCLAYAVTIHRIQGMTLKRIVVGNIKSLWLSSQLYVCLSRVCYGDHIKFLAHPNQNQFTESDLSIDDYMFVYGAHF